MATETVELAPVDSIPDAPVDGSAEPLGGGASLLPDEPTVDPVGTTGAGGTESDAPTDELEGTLRELRRTQAELEATRDRLQARLLDLEALRERAEQRVELAAQAVATRLVELFSSGENGRLTALIAVRDETDPQRRIDLMAALHTAERLLVEEQDAALDAAAATGAEADAVRLDVQDLGTRVAALDAAIEDRDAPTADERARANGSSYSFDADLVFATGPIPGIGYWGDAAGTGSALDGWMGFASAAVGGVGCEPPDPTFEATGQIEQGEASWYGPGFHGNATANGEPYDQMAMTAAHKTLPFGTIVRVYSSQTARCAFVRINDRGPFIDGRIIDLSRAAADQIGMESVAPVQVEVWAAPSAPTPVA